MMICNKMSLWFGLDQGNHRYTHCVITKEGSIRPISCICYIILLNLQEQNTSEWMDLGNSGVYGTFLKKSFRQTLNSPSVTHRLAVAAMEIVIQRIYISEKDEEATSLKGSFFLFVSLSVVSKFPDICFTTCVLCLWPLKYSLPLFNERLKTKKQILQIVVALILKAATYSQV